MWKSDLTDCSHYILTEAPHSDHSFSTGYLTTEENAHFPMVIFKPMCLLCPQLLSMKLQIPSHTLSWLRTLETPAAKHGLSWFVSYQSTSNLLRKNPAVSDSWTLFSETTNSTDLNLLLEESDRITLLQKNSYQCYELQEYEFIFTAPW